MTDPDPDTSAQGDRPRHAQTVVVDLTTMVATPVAEYANRNHNS